jgi:two-component system sensor histidine kinase KdpD
MGDDGTSALGPAALGSAPAAAASAAARVSAAVSAAGEGRLVRWRGAIAAALAPPVLTAVLDQVRGGLNLTSTVLLFLAVVVAIARLGGMLSALAAALWASLLLNYYFVLPLHSPSIANANDALALAVFIVVALTVASVVDLAARQSRRAARANAEAETLNALSVAVLRGDGALGALLDQLREAFTASAVSLLQEPRPTGTAGAAAGEAAGPWRIAAASGSEPPTAPEQADTLVPVEPGAVLALRGRVLAPSDRHVLSTFTAQATAALERRRLAASAAEAASLQAADKMRTALLAAVSHDLRAPLAAARTAVSTLADAELALDAEDRVELLEIADQSLMSLTRLVEDLLDMSRVQAGALKPRLAPLDVQEVLTTAIASLPSDEDRIGIEPTPRDLPQISADGPLLERVVANVLANALKHTDSRVSLSAETLSVETSGDRVLIKVADHGPGIPPEARDLVFRPFQRLGDRDNTAGVGLGLALARGLTESMGGTLVAEETPGGGLTMVLTLPAADEGEDGDECDGATHR